MRPEEVQSTGTTIDSFSRAITCDVPMLKCFGKHITLQDLFILYAHKPFLIETSIVRPRSLWIRLDRGKSEWLTWSACSAESRSHNVQSSPLKDTDRHDETVRVHAGVTDVQSAVSWSGILSITTIWLQFRHLIDEEQLPLKTSLTDTDGLLFLCLTNLDARGTALWVLVGQPAVSLGTGGGPPAHDCHHGAGDLPPDPDLTLQMLSSQ